MINEEKDYQKNWTVRTWGGMQKKKEKSLAQDMSIIPIIEAAASESDFLVPRFCLWIGERCDTILALSTEQEQGIIIYHLFQTNTNISFF